MPVPDRRPEYLTAVEVAALLGRTPGALYVERHRGQPPASLAVKVGRRLLWRRADLDRWWDSQLAENGGRE